MLLVKNVSNGDLNRLFSYYRKNSKNTRLLDRMWNVGSRVRPYMETRVKISPGSTTWEGGRRQSSSVMVSRDFTFSSVQSVSVKAGSDVVFNRSPRVMIIDLPSGNDPLTRSENWYLEVARSEYQALYKYFNPTSFGLPDDVGIYQKRGHDRKMFRKHVTPLFKNDPKAQDLYNRLCKAVSKESANRFNVNIRKLFNTRGGLNRLRSFCEHCFRINSTPYILAGIDGRQEFAVELPNSTDWNANYQIRNIEAFPRPDRGQPEIGLTIALRTEENPFNFNFRIEIRWSHGKFCGNPEGKLYKEFAYNDLPWVYKII